MRNNTFRRVLQLTAFFCMLIIIFSLPVFGYGLTGGGGGGDTPIVITPTPTDTIISDEVKTDDDKSLAQSLDTTGIASVSLAGKAVEVAQISPGVINNLAENNKPLVVANEGVSVQFTGQALLTSVVNQALSSNQATVNIGAKVVTEAAKQEIMANTALGTSTGIFEVGGKIVDLTATLVQESGSSSITSFNEPVAVTLDLSDLNLTAAQIQQLTATRMEKDASGNYVPVILGGTYNPVTKTFTFYTGKFSLYTVVQKTGLVNISMSIDNVSTMLNGTAKVIDAPPMLINGRTMVPLRYIAEALGVEVNWVEKTQTVTMKQGAKTLTFIINKSTPGMDVPATLVKNRTLVPIRYISESFGAQVNWVPSARTVQVFK